MMNKTHNKKRSPSCLSTSILLFVGIVMLVFLSFQLYRPDRPLPMISSGTSSGPAFLVQVIRPREGLPLGGLLPPWFFGVDAHLGFDSASEDAMHSVSEERIELSAEGWDLKLVFDTEGRLTAETEVVFSLIFEDRVRKVRCRPGEPVIGALKIIKIDDAGELGGCFDFELSNCVDAETGIPLGWPPRPFVLHGSFDRLPVGTQSE